MIALFDHPEILNLRNFAAQDISDKALDYIILGSNKIRSDILSMINQAGTGHIGGSLSSVDIYLMLWLCADIRPEKYNDIRDRVVISHGHTSAALYAVLGNMGFFDVQEAIQNFRKKETIFEGHPNCHIPGVEWGSGSLGQGLSVGCGFALASKLLKQSTRIFVVMSDGEQQKGQVTEAREFATKYNLSNLTGIIDYNKLQASGSTYDVMPCDIQSKYESSGWEVISINGHNFREIYYALKYAAYNKVRPAVILADTVMGKGISFIENNYEYHGRVLSKKQYAQASLELGQIDLQMLPSPGLHIKESKSVESQVQVGNPILYKTGDKVDCRSASGAAIYDLIKHNRNIPIAVLDTDLRESLKSGDILLDFPEKFVECGIQEHNAITISGALSKSGVLTFFPAFGVFGIDETYGQHRMLDINETSVKLISTHCGIDVGEDGKTHQCIDYISLINNLPGYKLIIPSDANQTDRVIRYIANTEGAFVVVMGRSKIPILENRRGEAYYSEDYSFVYGNSEWIREGSDAAILSTGTMVHMAVRASDSLLAENIHVGVLNISCPKELDMNTLRKACQTGVVITYEDHLVQSGLGSNVASLMAENSLQCRFKKMGIVKYGISCSPGEQYYYQGLDIENLQRTIISLLE